MRDAAPGSATASSSSWRIRIRRCWTRTRSPRDGGRSTGRSRCWGEARTSCRRRSRRSTPTSRATGPRSPGSTASSRDSPVRPVVDLNRAIAIAEVEGPGAGLAIVDDLPLTGYRYFHATRGELLSRLGRNDEAVVEYERALELTHDDAERRLLERRLAELDRAGSATIRWVVGVVTPLTRWTLRDGGVRRGVDLLRRQQDDGFVETALSPTVMPSAGQ
ncbi:MAG TPA: hypothetical protein VGJ99_08285 [Actinomycetota bacterium]